MRDRREVPVRVLAVDTREISSITATRKEPLPHTFVRNYEGTNAQRATLALDRERPLLRRAGYEAANTQWMPGSRSSGAILGALLRCIFLIGFLVLIILLMQSPPGVLRVTYQRAGSEAPGPPRVASSSVADELKKLATLRTDGVLSGRGVRRGEAKTPR